ncbi:peptidoglycan binding domain-containing protein [Clostridium sp. BSD9I1]|uniref:L,D-transpeptidase family protein n=1 Tax=Clostridium sp. BSD9I1 TaxID=2003589 RepID=UPI001644D282|nr:peptidoglycan binding domain-containing protein [Clostridium sp. BSD9I1]
MGEPKNKSKKIMILIVTFLATLLSMYLAMSVYFMNRFYFGSSVNCINVSGKTIQEANKELADEITAYTLILEGRGGLKEEIKSADISLKYNPDAKLQSLKDSQNPFKWIYGVFNKTNFDLSEVASYDADLLKKSIDNLSCFNANNIIESKNASFKYSDNGYKIVKEISGNKVNKNILYNHVVDTILKGETRINLESINCYEKPQYTSNSKEILTIKDMLDKYTSTKITYTFGQRMETLDGNIINAWINVDENLKVTFNEAKVKNYIDTLAKTYDTLGSTRNFITSSGKSISVSGGDYGWSINKSKEVQDIIAAVKNAKSITKKPVYNQTALSHGINDIGNTYVEINLSKQYLWFYKSGSLIVEGSIVTGNVSSSHSTPSGTYKLKYKQKDTVLRGADYAAPVSYWMPFNGGIGIHDANWRSTFGGNIYLTNGSHGCVNAPYYVAKAIFNNIEAGTPIICYY